MACFFSQSEQFVTARIGSKLVCCPFDACLSDPLTLEVNPLPLRDGRRRGGEGGSRRREEEEAQNEFNAIYICSCPSFDERQPFPPSRVRHVGHPVLRLRRRVHARQKDSKRASLWTTDQKPYWRSDMRQEQLDCFIEVTKAGMLVPRGGVCEAEMLAIFDYQGIRCVDPSGLNSPPTPSLATWDRRSAATRGCAAICCLPFMISSSTKYNGVPIYNAFARFSSPW